MPCSEMNLNESGEDNPSIGHIMDPGLSSTKTSQGLSSLQAFQGLWRQACPL